MLRTQLLVRVRAAFFSAEVTMMLHVYIESVSGKRKSAETEVLGPGQAGGESTAVSETNRTLNSKIENNAYSIPRLLLDEHLDITYHVLPLLEGVGNA